MDHKKNLKRLLSIISILVMFVSILVLIFGIWYYSIGSQESFPTGEQKEKAAIAAVFLIVLGLLGTVFGLFVYRKVRKIR